MTAENVPNPEQLLTEDECQGLARRAKSVAQESFDHRADTDQIVNKYIFSYHSLLFTCRSSGLSTGHQIAAWNALCAFVDQLHTCLLHPHEHDGQLQTLWQSAFDLFLDLSHDVRPKSSKQLLISVSAQLQKSSQSNAAENVRRIILKRVLDIIFDSKSQPAIRPALILLSHLLSKDLVSLEQARQLASQSSSHPASSWESYAKQLVAACIQWSIKADFTSAAGNTISVVIQKSTDGDQRVGQSFWVEPVMKALQADPEAAGSFRTYLLPAIFKQDQQGFLLLVKRLASHANDADRHGMDYAQIRSLLIILQAGKDQQLVVEIASKHLDISRVPVELPFAMIRKWLQHVDRSIRLTSLNLLVSSSSAAQMMDSAHLTLLKENLSHFHADADTYARGEMISLMQKFFDRLRTVLATLSRRKEPAQELLMSYTGFLAWYYNFLLSELRPDASYQRHITALKCLNVLIRSGIDQSVAKTHLSKSALVGPKWSIPFILMTEKLQRLLLDLIMDAYDDVRQASAAVLEIYSCCFDDSTAQRTSIPSMINKYDATMLANGRADQADGCAHLYTLLYSTAKTTQDKQSVFSQLIIKALTMVTLAEVDKAAAVERYPLHAALISMKSILIKSNPEDLDAKLIEQIVQMLSRIWHVVKPTLCNDAPEGYLPTDILETTEAVSTKSLLSYCWRALKEASLLAEAVLFRSSSVEFTDLITSVVELTFQQLAELRHRGAFATVAQTWLTCCEVTVKTSPEQMQKLYLRVLQLIQNATINTRRSAGVPQLLCGILIADQSGSLVAQTFASLESLARQPVGNHDESSLPQVHAMNGLKDVLKHSRLSRQSERYVSTTLRLATDSLRSPAWAIRNCGLMLLRATLDRLLGTHDSYDDATDEVKTPMDFRQQPELLNQVIALLEFGQLNEADGSNESIFPALQLLNRALLPEGRTEEINQHVFKLTANRSWLIRDKAARTLVSLMPSIEILKLIRSEVEHCRQQNQLHGFLLCLKHIGRTLRNKSQVATDEDLGSSITTDIIEIASVMAKTTTCYIIRDAAAELIAEHEDREPVSLHDGKRSSVSAMDEHNVLQFLSTSHGQAEIDDWFTCRSQALGKELHGVAINSGDYNNISSILNPLIKHTSDLFTVFEIDPVSGRLLSIEATLLGLRHFQESFQLRSRSSDLMDLFLRYCMLVYDLLNDDEEDVRVTAASVASHILGTYNESTMVLLEPMVAKEELLSFLVIHWSTNATFASICLSRILEDNAGSNRSLSDRLKDAMILDTTLFAEEKQNLHIDDAAEARSWTTAAKQINATVFAEDQLESFAVQVTDALDILIDQAETRTDGPLCWTSIDAVFVLGLRCIHGAELLLHIGDVGNKSPARSVVMSKLDDMTRLSRDSKLHPLWKDEIDRVREMSQ